GGHGYSGWWGAMGAKHQAQHNIITYSLSPYRQRAFAGAFKKGVFNVYRRTMAQIPYIVPPVLIGYGIYSWGLDRHHYYHSKE
ncbi:cytochrome b-c1 complex subunit 8, partial [Paraphysoderma sedebokerense]